MSAQACDVIGAEQPRGSQAAANSWGALGHTLKYGSAKLAYPRHLFGADDSAYGPNLRSGQSDQSPFTSREPNLLDIGDESEALLSAGAGEARQHEAGGADEGVQRGSDGAIARDPFESLMA